jgi:uncharacterized protein (DUF433 family)
MMGKPVIDGTRITFEHILEELGAGQTIGRLLEAHPRLARAARRRGRRCRDRRALLVRCAVLQLSN